MDYSYIPEGFYSVNPYLIVDNAVNAIDFYQKAFDAILQKKVAMPDGKIGHATIKIGNSTIMLANEFPDMG
ncbi:MAG TPA: VOC family protein, partial [Aquella sp.]|nr:VOC family protein [Aquella sp.]